MKKLILTAALFSIIYSFQAQINVVPVTSGELQIKNNTILYSLPKAVININVCVETEYFYAGPFHKYADKYLTIKNVETENSVTSEISGIKFSVSSEPDANSTYMIFNKDNNFNVGYCRNGVIKSFGFSESSDCSVIDDLILNIPQYHENGTVFTDLSVKRNFTNITDTTYKVVQIDSVFQKIPIYNKSITSKEFEQKAEEAANFIIKIRKNKFKLITGQFETEKPPKDLKYMVEELDKLEQEYMSLFIGKTIKIKNEFNFSYSPYDSLKTEKILLFNLSDELGITGAVSSDGEPVYLEITNHGVTSETDRFYNRQTELNDKEKKKGLYYRIPGYATVQVSSEGIVYAEQNMQIPQLGYTNYLPSKMFKNKKLKILFDENSGFIKTISNE